MLFHLPLSYLSLFFSLPGIFGSTFLTGFSSSQPSSCVTGFGKVKPEDHTELNYQFINTLYMKAEEFRPLDLPDGWDVSPETDPRHWITKATETAYYDLVANPEKRLSYFTDELSLPEDEQDERHVLLAKLLQKNPLFLNEPIFADELQKKADKLLSAYAIGRLRITGGITAIFPAISCGFWNR